MLNALGAAVVVSIGLQSALFLDPEIPLAPPSWAIISICIWFLYVISKGGWSHLTVNDKRRVSFGILASMEFIFFLQRDSEFKGWQSVYYFCGNNLQYCSCNFRWNVHGWIKASVLWQFVLSATLGAQSLVIQAGLGGLLPGEEAVTRESLISVCWRLIPFWLNNWEQQWGAEVSSMTFELPHFAVELLIILPCCQIICSRLKLLVTPQVNVLLGHGQGDVDEGPFVREDFAPNILQGFWERRPEQRKFLPRVRSNVRVLAFLTGLTALAAFNATLVPLYLEGQAAGAPSTPAIMYIARHVDLLSKTGSAFVETNVSGVERFVLLEARERYSTYGNMNCSDPEPYLRNVAKHAAELQRIQDPEHRALIPLVEAALAIMRLSCEKYFVLIAIYVAFLLFRDPPRPARVVIRVVARVSGVFQKVILFAFPVVCWLYNAGFIFSLFVSVVFWGGPLLALYDTARSTLREVSIRYLSPADDEQVERMGGSCAICWSDMTPQGSSAPDGCPSCTLLEARDAAGRPSESDEAAAAAAAEELASPSRRMAAVPDPKAAGWALSCGHAYHRECLLQWMEQCNSTGVKPTCPMCQRSIQLQVRWRLPRSLSHIVGAAAIGTGHPVEDVGGAAGGARRRVRVRRELREEPQGGLEAEDAVVGGAVPAEAGNEGLVDVVRNFAARDVGLQVLGLLEHQQELQELLHEPPAMEFGDMLREAEPLILQQAAQAHANHIREPQVQPQLQAVERLEPEQEQEQQHWLRDRSPDLGAGGKEEEPAMDAAGTAEQLSSLNSDGRAPEEMERASCAGQGTGQEGQETAGTSNEACPPHGNEIDMAGPSTSGPPSGANGTSNRSQPSHTTPPALDNGASSSLPTETQARGAGTSTAGAEAAQPRQRFLWRRKFQPPVGGRR